MEELLDQLPVEYIIYGLTAFIFLLCLYVGFVYFKDLKKEFVIFMEKSISEIDEEYLSENLFPKIMNYLDKRTKDGKPIKGYKILTILLKSKKTPGVITFILKPIKNKNASSH